MALLEAVVALSLLAWGGVSLISVLSALTRELQHRRAAERQVQLADRVLTAAVLLDRRDLDRQIGIHPAAGLVLVVQRPEPGLYRLSVADSAAPAFDLLATVVFRRDSE
jgi:hypothetical protein